ncbi:2-amino-3-ketobutyrate coenzyme A ligase, mitochondrial-like [Watersipora subatra]|uniref:2-amino-3-ketobutyrate coenzyme A ligase, mitochondrial-like n=1 Tax=Watersipora subatra TaxID=2589382 RepID=UPI00355BCF3B
MHLQALRQLARGSLSLSRCLYSSCTALPRLRSEIGKQLDDIRAAGTFKEERVITSKQDNLINVEGSQQQVLNFCANNYLGLSSHPAVIQAGIEALQSHANGMSSVRFICGTNDMHINLEQLISQFHSRDDTILYASCFDANAGIFEVLLQSEDAIFSDELNHASIIDGVRLCKANKYRYKHNDMSDLENQLKENQKLRPENRRLIVTDGVFSMDGNVCKLREMCDLADEYNAITLVDECHATGFLGNTGRGTEEYLGVSGRVTLINSTLGKALGGAAGGYTTGPQEVITLLRQKSRPYLFSNALPPPVVGSAIKVFEMLMNESSYAGKVFKNTTKFRTAMTEAGFNLAGDPAHPICPVMLGDEKLAHTFADMMLEQGIYVIGFSYPVVPLGKARIRVQISACHTDQDIDRAIDAFISVGRKLNVIQ